MFNSNKSTEVREYTYKNEKYSACADGKIMRHSREGKKKRLLDDEWSIGKSDVERGFLHIGSERVHRIVAFAFLGEPQNQSDVVYHVDGNKENNHISNLKWVTKFESFISNVYNQNQLEILCGIDLKILLSNFSKYSFELEGSKFSWLMDIPDEEALRALEFLKPKVLNVNCLTNTDTNIPCVIDYYESLTEGAIQANWKTPCEFVCCPPINEENSIKIYTENLKVGELFLKNRYGQSTVSEFAITNNDNELYVVTENLENMKKYAIAKVTFEKGLFIHASLGSFFSLDGAQKEFTLVQGLEWTGEDSVDDYC